jgi:DNA repair exonuclease SbcCD ATPase subunit
MTDAEGDELRAEISRLWAKLEAAEQERRGIEADRDRLIQEATTLAARLEPQTSEDHERELTEVRLESEAARRELEAIASDLSTLRSAYSEIEADRGRLAAELEAMRSQAASAGERQLTELAQAKEQAEQWRQQAEEAQRAAAESIARHAAESAALRLRVEELESSAGARIPDEILLAERDLALAERDRLQAQVIEAEARVRLARLESGQGSAKPEVQSELERQLAEERRALQTALDELAKVRAQKETHQGDIDRVAQLENQLRQSDRVIEDLRSQIARLEYSSRQARSSQNGNGGRHLEPLAVVPGLTKFAERRLNANGVLSLAHLAALDIHDPVIDPELKSEFPDLPSWIEHARRLTKAGNS